MEKQNITISLPKQLLVKIKHIAIDRRTSVSGLLAKTLTEIVERDGSYLKAKHHSLSILKKGFNLNTKGQISWSRDDVHER